MTVSKFQVNFQLLIDINVTHHQDNVILEVTLE